MSKRNKILIVGSSGMLGCDLWKELCADYEVEGTDLVENRQSTIGRFYKEDITERESIEDVIAEADPDFVVHAAAMTDVDGCELAKDRAYKINSEGTKNVALACEAAGATLIYISTDFVFDGKKSSPYKEDDKPAPLNVYGDSKLKGEIAVRENVKKHYIIRTSWLYGKNGKNFVDTIAAKARAEKVLKVVDDQVGSPTYTVDLACAMHALLKKLTNSESRLNGYGIYHVSNSGSVSWFEYAREIVRLSGSTARVLPISSEELNRPARRPAMSAMDCSKFAEYTGYRMRSWKEALKEYMVLSIRKEKVRDRHDK
ncbi:MAG: dTDP-4-dehydrorhamnose reductase [Candidatus Omnitrophica bacterium]|nr:dTDP-4-dehydrorhamnose reductase [Candidatus Omnitrophota bacterium]MCM8790661.1 dTDP-4-dehydrorhamnose reductase [Candidatus Omnitrophota bacterium]